MGEHDYQAMLDLNRLMRPAMVCVCRRVPEECVRDAVQNRGARNFEDVQAITNCSTGCGTCETEVRALIEKFRN